jgi:hypothetical protein
MDQFETKAKPKPNKRQERVNPYLIWGLEPIETILNNWRDPRVAKVVAAKSGLNPMDTFHMETVHDDLVSAAEALRVKRLVESINPR